MIEAEAPIEAGQEIDQANVEQGTVEATDETAGLDLQGLDSFEAPIQEFINGIEDPTGRKTFFDKFKNLNDGYTTKYSDLGKQRKELEEQLEAFSGDKQFLDSYRGFESGMNEQHKTAIMAQYGSVPNYMNTLYNMDRLATENPQQFLTNYMANMGISRENLDQILSGQAYQQQTNQLSQNNFEKQMMQKMEEKLQAQKAQDEIMAFTNAIDEGGNPKYPHFEQVRNAMASLESAYPDKSLEELYDMAVYADPTIRQDIMSSQVQAQAKNLTEQKEVQKAKSVAGVKSSVGSTNAKQNRSWKAVLADQLD